MCVVFESSVGGVILKSSMRILGTALAGLLGIGQVLHFFTDSVFPRVSARN